MDLRQLRYFIAVAEEGNYSRAAERLHISQPPLSQQIKSLEGTLRVTLFERGRHGARLTRAGEALLTRARRIVDDCDSVERQVRRVAEGLEGYLRIGIINSVMYGPLPLTLRQFQLRNPGVEWTLHELLPDQQYEALARGRIDVGFSCSAAARSDLRSILVYAQPLVVAMASDHPLARAPRVSLRQLSGDAFVLLNMQSPMIRNVLAACLREGFEPRVMHESVDPETVLGLVGAGVGVSVLPASLSATRRDDVSYVPLAARRLDADLHATVRREHALPALERFLALLEDVTRAWHREVFGARPAQGGAGWAVAADREVDREVDREADREAAREAKRKGGREEKPDGPRKPGRKVRPASSPP
ncbi:LysR substrate-binding domain-containing protein [Cupriavidus gilardii]|uniref:LysR substrate-binding domain-containing protein n=1 Tax=Cupriavidus gilardii TaxID=82541 RepID=UPI0021BF9A6E|nr:LysR substrate-binding domain-containing protein [Cupriavidus gilardii]MCT9115647.1 LysR substrate-binding domain-containing protein [Cupriavidus gilardii]